MLIAHENPKSGVSDVYSISLVNQTTIYNTVVCCWDKKSAASSASISCQEMEAGNLQLCWLRTWWTTVGQQPWHGTPKHHRLLKLHSGLETSWNLCISISVSYSRFPNKMPHLLWTLSRSPVVFLGPASDCVLGSGMLLYLECSSFSPFLKDVLTPTSVHFLRSSPKFLSFIWQSS